MMFFFNDASTTEIYTYVHTLALHDALPISLFRAQSGGEQVVRRTEEFVMNAVVWDASQRQGRDGVPQKRAWSADIVIGLTYRRVGDQPRSEEHTSELSH